MGDDRHVDMFSRTKYDPQIDSAQLEIQKSSFKRSNWGEELPFERYMRVFTLISSVLEVKKSEITIWVIIDILICFLGWNITRKSIPLG